MGIYLNPPNQTKESFIEQHGLSLTRAEFLKAGPNPAGMYPFALIDNGNFFACALCYEARDIEAFTDPTDDRPCYYYHVPREAMTAEVVGEYMAGELKRLYS